MTVSKSWGSQRPKASHLVKPGGGLKGEVYDLRSDLESAFSDLEAKTDLPDLQWVDGGAFAAAGGDIVIQGADLLQGQTAASLTLWATTSEVEIIALKPGEAGNSFTIQVTDTETAGSESCTKTGNAFVIGIEAGVSTANQIATAINADASDANGYLTAISGGAGTTNDVVAVTNMAGGAGEGFTCYVSGVEALPANTTGNTGVETITDTKITVTVPDLTGESPARAIGDQVAIRVVSDGVMSNTLTSLALT